ncbi:MAG: ATP-binding protein [Gemmiger sp.]|nr:ATP-binding protein [Gemmiger sp.]
MAGIKRGWRVGCAFLLCLLLFGLWAAPAHAAPGDTLRVAFCPLSGFFEYDEAGKETGYGVELLDKLSKYTGIQFTYVPADGWEDTKQMLLDGRADIRMPGTAPSVPSTDLGYTQHNIMDTFYAVLTLNSREDLIYNDYATLGTLRCAVTRGLKKVSPVDGQLAGVGMSQENLVDYENYNACRAALDAGEVDAVITNILDMTPDMKQLARFPTVCNYISMTLGNPYLDVLNDALAELSMDEPAFLANLYKKWFPDRVVVPFTREELEYLNTLGTQEGSGLNFYFHDGEGFLSRRENDGSMAGFYPLLAARVADKVGVPCTLSEMTDAVQRTYIFPEFYYDYGWAASHNTEITKPYFIVSYYKIFRKGGNLSPETGKVAAVNNFRVTEDLLNSGYTQDQLVLCEDYEACLEAVQARHADITYLPSYAADYYLNLYRYNALSAVLSEYSHQVCFAVYGEQSALLASILDKVLAATGDEELNALLVECTALRPTQNLLLEWLYENPLRSVAVISSLVAALVVLGMVLLFMARTRRQNMALLQATQAKQSFLARMSHDMRTPMNAIIGFSAFGQESTALDESKGYHTKINRAGRYLLQLINDSLDLSKLETGKYRFNLEPTGSEEFVEALRNILQPRAEEKGITLTIRDNTIAQRKVLFDKLRLQQIFVNLLNNAIKFTPPGGHVVLTLSGELQGSDTMQTAFTVADDGIGMSEEFQKERMYAPFEQADAGEMENGTGLGLSIVKELVDAMGGQITCESAPGKGTTFTVTITTKLAEPCSSPAPAAAPAAPAADALQSLAGKRVLVCEDHPMNREIAARLLKKVGMLVEDAPDGQQGVAQFAAAAPGYYSAILMDVRMPVMDGLAATRAIRALPRPDAATIPILAMTANAFAEDAQACVDAGMNEHLAKPIDPQALYQALAEQIARATP